VGAALEALAIPVFKPSTAVKETLNLRKKGVSLLETLSPPYNWARVSFFTMFGAYNYNAIKATPLFYYVALAPYGIFLVYLVSMIVLGAGKNEILVLAGAGTTVALVIALVIHHSWVADFQPQGRYLFALFGIVAILLARNAQRLSPVAINLFIAACFVLSAYSFTKHGLLRTPDFKDIIELAPEFRRPA